jgi:predicted amidohydrolase YtcJ
VLILSDIVIKSNHIFTATEKRCIKGFIAIDGNRITKIGRIEDAETYINGRTKVVNAADRMIVPGFIESHMHFYKDALVNAGKIKVVRGRSENECVGNLIAEVEKSRMTYQKGQWIVSKGWYLPEWENKVLPTRHSLDAVYPDNPVAMFADDGHTMWVNSLALAKLRIDKNSIPPKGGNFVRDEQGELTGVLEETGAMIYMKAICKQLESNIILDYEKLMQKQASYGLTSFADLALLAIDGDGLIYDEYYYELFRQNRLLQRVHMFPTLLMNADELIQKRKKYHFSQLRFSGGKQFYDGVTSTHTAYLKEPYTNAYYPGDVGKLTVKKERMEQYVLNAAKHGIPVRIHTIGDAAIKLALDAFEKAINTYGPLENGHYCLEHLEVSDHADIERMAKLGIVSSVQPSHPFLDMASIEETVGARRVRRMWAFKDMVDSGVTLAFGTDAPVVIDTTPLDNIYFASTRKTLNGNPKGGWLPEQRISVADAIIAHTKGASFAIGRENELGTLAEGKLADITVLERDILQCDPDKIANTRVLLTLMDGRVTYKS